MHVEGPEDLINSQTGPLWPQGKCPFLSDVKAKNKTQSKTKKLQRIPPPPPPPPQYIPLSMSLNHS